MNNLEKLGAREVNKKICEAARITDGMSDNIHDLKIFIDSNGSCEVDQQEAMQLINAVVTEYGEVVALHSEAVKWSKAMDNL